MGRADNSTETTDTKSRVVVMVRSSLLYAMTDEICPCREFQRSLCLTVCYLQFCNHEYGKP